MTKTLRDVGEDEAIASMVRMLGTIRGATVGPGDDCAVVSGDAKSDWILTSDPLIEGVHFLPEDEPRWIGHKAVGRALSDLAAMGGEPLWLLINVVAPPSLSLTKLQAMYRGAVRLCRAHDAQIVGGDLSSGRTLEWHVFALGRVPKGRAVLRSGARPGDRLFVTGTLGGSRLGRHLRFEPRVREGAWLRGQRWATSMMDVSDGLATDLRRLCRISGVGAVLDRSQIPVSRSAHRMKGLPWEHALTDGEDFELLFTVPASKVARFTAAWSAAFSTRCTQIGEVKKGRPELWLRTADGTSTRWSARGYEHF
jgi:thiamine-monophosphate kinase